MNDDEIAWIDGDDAFNGSTKLPDVVKESSQITIAIFLLVAVAAIILLFALGIFMDCLHQKKDMEDAERKKNLRKLKLPKLNKHFSKSNKKEDKDCIIENMEINQPSTSNGIV